MSNRKNPPSVDVRRRHRDPRPTDAQEMESILTTQNAESHRPVAAEGAPADEPQSTEDLTTLGESVGTEAEAHPSAMSPGIETPRIMTTVVKPVEALEGQVHICLEGIRPRVEQSLRVMKAFAELMASVKAVAEDKGDATLLDWVSRQPYTRRNLILVLMKAPTAMPDLTRESFKSLLEVEVQRISGAARGFTVFGDKKLEYAVNASSINTDFNERYGRVIGKIFEVWAEKIGKSGANAATTAEFMLIEPDPTYTKVLDAWHCESMYPAEMSTNYGSREPFVASERTRVHVNWAGKVTFQTDPAKAQRLLDELHAASANPHKQATEK